MNKEEEKIFPKNEESNGIEFGIKSSFIFSAFFKID